MVSRKFPEGSLRIPLPRESVIAAGVYFRSNRRLEPEDLLLLLRAEAAWAKAGGAGRPGAKELPWDRIGLILRDARDIPAPLPFLVDSLGDEAGRFRSANRLALLHIREGLGGARPGLRALAAAARALGESLDGFIFDPLLLRLVSGRARRREGPPGDIAIVEHIGICHSIGDRGLGWVTTQGMAKFGLPNLEVRDVPPDLCRDVGAILNGLAGILARRVRDLADRSRTPPREILVEPELVIAASDIARSRGELPDDRGIPCLRSAPVRLVFAGAGGDGLESLISVDPPSSSADGRGVWLHELVLRLLGRQADTLSLVEPGNAAVEDAHRRAVARLGEVKARFRRGLPPGSCLLVKHGFGAEGGSREFMWVAVNTWRGSRIQGQLASAPHLVEDLRAGDPIEMDQEEVFDWMIEGRDGSREGGFTENIFASGEEEP